MNKVKWLLFYTPMFWNNFLFSGSNQNIHMEKWASVSQERHRVNFEKLFPIVAKH